MQQVAKTDQEIPETLGFYDSRDQNALNKQAFRDYLTDHSFLSSESVGWRTGQINLDSTANNNETKKDHV